MDNSWKQDPRVKKMNPEKIQFLTDFAEKIEKSPKNQLSTIFMSLTMEANTKGIHFSDQETDLLVSILTNKMNPEDRKKLDMLKLLSKKLAKQH